MTEMDLLCLLENAIVSFFYQIALFPWTDFLMKKKDYFFSPKLTSNKTFRMNDNNGRGFT